MKVEIKKIFKKAHFIRLSVTTLGTLIVAISPSFPENADAQDSINITTFRQSIDDLILTGFVKTSGNTITVETELKTETKCAYIESQRFESPDKKEYKPSSVKIVKESTRKGSFRISFGLTKGFGREDRSFDGREDSATDLDYGVGINFGSGKNQKGQGPVKLRSLYEITDCLFATDSLK